MNARRHPHAPPSAPSLAPRFSSLPLPGALRVLALWLPLAACAAGQKPGVSWAPLAADAKPVARSSGGSRLKARFAVAPNGQRQFLHFYDTVQKTACTFQPAEDGATRCLPEPPRAELFEDSDCRTALHPAEAACAGAYVAERRSGAVAVFRVGATRSVAKAYGRVRGQDGRLSCVRQKLPEGATFFARGADVPPERFVSATEPRPQRLAGVRIVPRVRVASDGAVELVGLYDTALGVGCFADVSAEGDYRCFPAARTASIPEEPRTFSDARCQAPLVAVHEEGGIAYLQRRDWSVCPRRVSAWKAEERADLGRVYTPTMDDVCRARGPEEGATLYAPGEPLPPSAFGGLTLTQAEGRLTERRLAAAGGASELYTGLWDARFSEPCDFRRTTDGLLRCVPRVTPAFLYADAACTIRAARPPRSSTTCDRAPVLHAAFEEGPWCAPVVRTMALGSPAPQVFTRAPDGACAPLDPAKVPGAYGPQTARFAEGSPQAPRAVAGPLAPTTFEAGAIVDE